MPIVKVTLVEGRSPAQLEKMISRVSEAIAESLDAPIESVRIMVSEMKPHQYGIGGESWPTVKARRDAAVNSSS